MKIIVLFMSLFAMSEKIVAQISENEIKAVYIEKFTHFIDWQDSLKIENPEMPFVFGFLGEDEIYNTFANLYKNMSVKNKKVVIVQYKSADEIQDCHLVFIASSEKRNIYDIVSLLADSPILLIGDTEGYALAGVHINFYEKTKNILFEINPDAFKKSNLYISHHLMRAAKIVRP